MYAEMVLLLFYPHQKLNNLTDDGSYWKIFHKELQCHLFKTYTKFWEKGFEILQNIEDRATLQKHLKPARDPISMATIIKKPDEANKNQTDFSDIDQAGDILDIGIQLRWVINSIYFNTRKNAILTVYANHIVR
jgi:hypothetical protein